MELFKSESQRHLEDYKRFRNHQSKLEVDLEHRLSQLDSAEVRLNTLEHMSEEFKNEIIDIKDYIHNIDHAKLDKVKFEERFLELYTDFRKTKIKAEKVSDHAKSLENFLEKYTPLQIQNALSKTLHGFISPTQKVRLEDYEVQVLSELHESILDDNGVPNLDQQRDRIADEISERMLYLQQMYKERHLSISKISNKGGKEDSEGESKKENGVPKDDENDYPKDDDDIVQMFKNQISIINETLDKLPSKLRKIDEKIDKTVNYKFDESDRHTKMLEAKITNVLEDLEEHKLKLSRDKKKLRDHVNDFKVQFEDFKTDYKIRVGLIKSLSGVTSCLLESTCIKAFIEESEKDELQNEEIKRAQLK